MPIDISESVQKISNYVFGNTFMGYDLSNAFITALIVTIVVVIIILIFSKKSTISLVFYTICSTWVLISAHDNLIYNNLKKPENIMSNIAISGGYNSILSAGDTVSVVNASQPNIVKGGSIEKKNNNNVNNDNNDNDDNNDNNDTDLVSSAPIIEKYTNSKFSLFD